MYPDGTARSGTGTTSPTPWVRPGFCHATVFALFGFFSRFVLIYGVSPFFFVQTSSASSLASSSTSVHRQQHPTFAYTHAHPLSTTTNNEEEELYEDDPLSWHTTQKETIGRRGTTLSRGVRAVGRQLARVRSWGDVGFMMGSSTRRGSRMPSGTYDGGVMSLRQAFGMGSGVNTDSSADGGGSLSPRAATPAGSIPIVQVLEEPVMEGTVIIGVAVEQERVEVDAATFEQEWGALGGDTGSRATSSVGHYGGGFGHGLNGYSMATMPVSSVTSHVSVVAPASTTLSKAKGRRRASTGAGAFLRSVVVSASMSASAKSGNGTNGNTNGDNDSPRSVPSSPQPGVQVHDCKVRSMTPVSPSTPTAICFGSTSFGNISNNRMSPSPVSVTVPVSPTTPRSVISAAISNANSNSNSTANISGNNVNGSVTSTMADSKPSSGLARIAKVFAQNLRLRRKSVLRVDGSGGGSVGVSPSPSSSMSMSRTVTPVKPEA